MEMHYEYRLEKESQVLSFVERIARLLKDSNGVVIKRLVININMPSGGGATVETK